ncbi:hypothetical protein M9Y10_029443 [Tritrichomonas musculus]|uniref:Integrase catalytic domain-containing protein n=1 Tax=Tritrichomonas musculus TaxID=1915356 RepID=A0ABR2KQF9_9EUKA
MIIGVRSIWTLNKRRNLRFSIIIRKYLKEKFHEKAKELYPDDYNIPLLDFINLKISDDRIDEIVNKMDQKDVIAFLFNINSWLPVTSDLREIYQDLSRCLKNQTDFKNFLKLAARNYSEDKKDGETDEDFDKRMKQKRAEMIHTINKYPAEELIMKYDLGFWFDQSTDNSIYYGSENKDIQMDGFYENESFKEIIYSSRNNNALDPFFYVSSILSDQDKSYLSKKVLTFMKDHNINYKTTLDNDHNKLSIINRFMRTVRDMKDRNNADILNIVKAYNNIPHSSLNDKSPNKFTEEDELNYIKNQSQINPYDFEPGERVRLVLDKNPLQKVRTNLSKVSYIIDSRVGNQFMIKASDDSIDTAPGYKIIRCV